MFSIKERHYDAFQDVEDAFRSLQKDVPTRIFFAKFVDEMHVKDANNNLRR